jgi:hypothetical protein
MKKTLARLVDIFLSPVTFFSAWWLKKISVRNNMPLTDKIYSAVGILPVTDVYYNPLVNPRKHLRHSLRDDRPLAGIDFNDSAQLNLLSSLKYNDELKSFPLDKTDELSFYYNNPSFAPGDSEFLYSIVRHLKPKRIIEIGSGNSTLMVRNALNANAKENAACEHICIEPYEMPWLEKLGISIVRKRVEDVPMSFFETLQAGDILFIDSSHVIRPQGDVLFEYLEILPVLNKGVVIHVHDIFTPKDYLDDWIFTHRLWNEQYLLEAFLYYNNRFEIIGALNYLYHHHRKSMEDKFPILTQKGAGEPGSFWLRKR